MGTQGKPYEDREREKMVIYNERGPQKTRTTLTPWSWTSSPQNPEKINFGCLNQPVCVTL